MRDKLCVFYSQAYTCKVEKGPYFDPRGTKKEVFHCSLRVEVGNIAHNTILECTQVDSRFCYSLTETPYPWYVDSSYT